MPGHMTQSPPSANQPAAGRSPVPNGIVDSADWFVTVVSNALVRAAILTGVGIGALLVVWAVFRFGGDGADRIAGLFGLVGGTLFYFVGATASHAKARLIPSAIALVAIALPYIIITSVSDTPLASGFGIAIGIWALFLVEAGRLGSGRGSLLELAVVDPAHQESVWPVVGAYLGLLCSLISGLILLFAL